MKRHIDDLLVMLGGFAILFAILLIVRVLIEVLHVLFIYE